MLAEFIPAVRVQEGSPPPTMELFYSPLENVSRVMSTVRVCDLENMAFALLNFTPGYTQLELLT